MVCAACGAQSLMVGFVRALRDKSLSFEAVRFKRNYSGHTRRDGDGYDTNILSCPGGNPKGDTTRYPAT